MEKIVLWGAGYWGKRAFEEYGTERVICFIDNYHKDAQIENKEIISFDTYRARNYSYRIIICVWDFQDIVKELWKAGIEKFSLYHGIYISGTVPRSEEIAHTKWIYKLKELADFSGKEVLEIGSRVVTGANNRRIFEKAVYTGFDIYPGENVDVVGDAHRLSSYFEKGKKFDLIFCSAVFEHLMMPWLVADEMIRLLKPEGYIFVETHYSYASHERPWHFFQFSEQALKVLFSENRGIKCIEAGVSNPYIGIFSEEADEYLQGKLIGDLYCHSEFLGQKVEEVKDLSWNNNFGLKNMGMYPVKKEKE